MSKVTGNIQKEVVLRNEIKVDDVVVVGQSASINTETNNVFFSEWKNDMNLYEANRTEIRGLMFAFEDEAFAVKAQLIEETQEA